MDLACDWQFADKDKNKRLAVCSVFLFTFALILYMGLILFSNHPYKYAHIIVWVCVFSGFLFFFSTTASFSWRSTTVNLSKTDNGRLVLYVDKSIVNHGMILDCKYIFSDYDVKVFKRLDEGRVDIVGVCTLQYIENGQVVDIDNFESKWIGIRIDKEEMPAVKEYFVL